MTIIFYCCLFSIIVQLSSQQFASYFEGTYRYAADTANSLGRTIGIYEYCPFVDNIMEALNETLPRVILGQQGGIESIVNAIAAWEFQKRAGLSEPLVLAITGPTGVGKSETGFQIANSIFSEKSNVDNTKRSIPNGLLIFRGEDFSADSDAAAIGIG